MASCPRWNSSTDSGSGMRNSISTMAARGGARWAAPGRGKWVVGRRPRQTDSEGRTRGAALACRAPDSSTRSADRMKGTEGCWR
jgi:hypothetical protein